MKQIISLVACILICSITIFAQKKDKPVNWKKLKYKKTASGLEYAIVTKTKGPQAQNGDKVSVHYTGRLLNDTIFDSSVGRGQPFSFKLGAGQVIKGWDEGIALLRKGEKAFLRIPSQLGYGERGIGTIPANSTLVFEVELIDFVEGIRPWNVKGLDTIKTASGLKIVKIAKIDTAKSPKAGDKVMVNYSGYFLDGKMFDSSVERGQPFKFKLGKGEVIKGWDEGVALLKKGERAKFIIPAELAYGSTQRGPIAPNSTLVFDVELLDFYIQAPIVPYDTTGKEMKMTASGLKYYLIQKSGNPVKASPGMNCVVHYTGYLEDGKIFDSSVEREQPFKFVLGNGQVIKGWEEGVSLMNMGDKFTFIIPYNLAYGEEGFNIIPAKATLRFDVELLLISDGQTGGHGPGDGHNH